MQWLFIGLFTVGGMFATAWHGADDKKQKRTYGIVALGLWALCLVLANILL